MGFYTWLAQLIRKKIKIERFSPSLSTVYSQIVIDRMFAKQDRFVRFSDIKNNCTNYEACSNLAINAEKTVSNIFLLRYILYHWL